MMWLCAELTPKYKTIANFRKENSKPLKKVFREFVILCKELDLITGELVAVDGAFLKANASKNQLIMKKSVERDLKKIDEKIESYLETMEFADKEEKKATQYNRTDPDAKVMVKPAHNLVAYNVQIAVDNKHKFIVATDVSSVGQDSNQLYKRDIRKR